MELPSRTSKVAAKGVASTSSGEGVEPSPSSRSKNSGVKTQSSVHRNT